MKRPYALLAMADWRERMRLQERLEQEGWYVRPASDGAEALAELWSGASPDALLVANDLPDLEPVDLLTAARRINPAVADAAFVPLGREPGRAVEAWSGQGWQPEAH